MRSEQSDADLYRVFSEIGEVEQDEMFVNRVSKVIARRRYTRLAAKTLCAGVALVIVCALMPVLLDLTYGIALGSDIFVRGIIVAVLSPVGYAIGGGAGLLFFLRMRS